MADIELINEKARKRMLLDLATNLPKHPPLTLTGDLSVNQICNSLTSAELDVVYAHYKELGGTMDKTK